MRQGDICGEDLQRIEWDGETDAYRRSRRFRLSYPTMASVFSIHIGSSRLPQAKQGDASLARLPQDTAAMSLKDEIDKLVQAEREKLIAQDQKNEEFYELKRPASPRPSGTH